MLVLQEKLAVAKYAIDRGSNVFVFFLNKNKTD